MQSGLSELKRRSMAELLHTSWTLLILHLMRREYRSNTGDKASKPPAVQT